MLELNTLIQTLGPAGLAFFIMWLWLKSVSTDKDKAQDALAELQVKSQAALLELQTKSQDALQKSQDARLTELREMLPLLTETSNGLQELLKTSVDSDAAMLTEIVSHIDKKFNEIETLCKKNNKEIPH